jgi:ubiquinone/menaquinone biosynthesis C-methylase UbiE
VKEQTTWQERGTCFGSAAEIYDRTRPGYPEEAVTWILGERPRSVLDLGAGTGILTRRLAASGHEVTAVEPDDAMRALLEETMPGAAVLAGRAESIPVRSNSADAVLVGHAYHWFTPEPAHREIARVLRPGGTFAALWNLRDEDVPWSAELSAILNAEDDGIDPGTAAAMMLRGVGTALRGDDGDRLPGWVRNPTFGDGFGPIQRGFFANSAEYTAETLIDLVKSRSYYLTSTAARQAELEERLRHLLATHPGVAGREVFPLPYITVVFRAVRRNT